MRAIFLILIFSVSFSTAQNKLKVLATASMWQDMAQVIGGDLIETDVIVPRGSDPHQYEPTPNDVLKIKSADLILVNGLSFEGWLNQLIQQSSKSNKQVLLTEGITAIQDPIHNQSTDPHAWMDAVNAQIYAERIFQALSEMDPVHEKEYEFNFNIYKKQLQDLHDWIVRQIAMIPTTQRVIITTHDAFRYYGNRYGMEVHSLLGISTDADVRTEDYIAMNKLIQEKNIPAIFIENTVNPKMINSLVKAQNIKLGGALYADSLGDSQSPASTYIEMMKQNTLTLVNALKVQLSNRNSSFQISRQLIIAAIVVVYILILSLIGWINRKTLFS
ncbi:MAG TPA: zinc ABC transporter substrate-binding protein [Saprospiraceae bacterium]|nr:zinc ABC transporter substrate-binding protein [Saprospiraceae bacterium]